MGGVKVGDGAGSMWLVLVSESVSGSESKVVEGLGAGCAQSVPPGVRLRLELSELVMSKWEEDGVGVDSARSDIVDSILL